MEGGCKKGSLAYRLHPTACVPTVPALDGARAYERFGLNGKSVQRRHCPRNGKWEIASQHATGAVSTGKVEVESPMSPETGPQARCDSRRAGTMRARLA